MRKIVRHTEEGKEIPIEMYDKATMYYGKGMLTNSEIKVLTKKLKDYKSVLRETARTLYTIATRDKTKLDTIIAQFMEQEDKYSLRRFSKIADCMNLDEQTEFLAQWVLDNSVEEYLGYAYDEYIERLMKDLVNDKDLAILHV